MAYVDEGVMRLSNSEKNRPINLCSSSDGSETAISITLFLEMLYRDMPCANKMIFSLADSERSMYAR